MSSIIINDIIKQLEMDNKRQASEMLKAAREQLGLSPTGQFVTQDSASSLLHDKAWVEQRGAASDSKKRKISSEISAHSKQRSGLLGTQMAKEIALIRELYKDDAERLSQEENKIKQQAKQAGAQIKAQEADALKAVQELKSVSERRDNFAVSRANEYARIQQEAEKSNKRFQAEIEALSRQAASGANVDKQVEDLRKRMSASYKIKTPPVSAKQKQAQFVAPQIDVAQLAQTNANKILDAYVEQSRKQVRQRASTNKKIGGQKVTPTQWKKGRYAFDTETTGVNAGDMPVTFGLGGYNEAGQKVIKDYFLSYGDKKKTSAKIIAAANVRDMNNQLIESAVQLRNRLGIAGSSDITSIDSDTWNKLVKPNLITPTQLVKELDSLGITSQTASDKLYSFNGKSFDIPMIDKWVSQYAKTTKTSGVAGSKLQDILSKTVNNDIFQVLKETFRYTESHGSISKGDSILQADSSKANSRIKNSSTLQRFFSIVSGHKSSGAHGAGDDAASTIDVASWAMTTELFEGVASELESRVAAQGGNYKSGGYFTNQYKATINQALDQMVGVMDDQTSNPASQVVPNQVIVDKFKKLGKDVSNIANGKVSVDSLKQRLVSEYAKVGIGVKFEGNKVGLYPLKDFATPEEASWDKIASVEMAVLDGSGSLRRGQQAVANIVYPSHIFEGEGKRPTPVVYSSNEAQYMHLLKQIGANPDVETKLVQAIKGGNTDYASRIMDIGVKNVLSGVPTATTSTVRGEAVEQVHGMKNPEQMAAISGMFSTNEMAEELLRYKKSVVQQIYDQLHEAGVFKYQRTFDPNNLSQDEYSAVTTAYALIAQGYDDESVFQGDSLTKRLTLSPEFRQFQEEVRMFASQGLMPSVESLKEETVLSGFLTTSGAHDILPLNIFGDASNRALNQVFNYNERAFAPQMGSAMKFSSKVGRALGVDYDKAEMQQYTGATTDDSALLKALQELGLSLKYANVSVEEGGMVIPQRLADELASYRPATYKAYAEDINPFFVSQTLGITPNSLDELAVGDTVRFNDLTIDEGHIKSFSKDLSLTQGDVIVGLKKLADGFELITKRFEIAKQGTKLLTEGGGRQTARVMANEDYDALVSKMGLSGANFLTENKTMASRSIMPALRGRLSYMIDEAFKQNPNINMDEVLKVLRETTQIGKSFSIGEDGKLQSSAFFDVKSKSYKYYDDSGELQDLITAGAGEDIDDVIRKAFVESATNSDFSKFGQALLGDNYSATLGLTSQFINMANEVPYYDPVGSGNADALESHGRVKVADRERRAATRTFSNAEAILISEGIEEGLRLFMQDEERQMNQYGKRGLQAQEQVKGLERAIATTAAGGYTNANDTYVELVYGASGALKDNQIDIKGMTTGFEYGEDGSGMTEEQYQNTIMGIARKKAAELGYKDVVLNYNGKKHLLGDIVSQQKHDGKYLPSVTDRANDSIFRALAQESAEIAQAAIAEVFNPQKGEYDRIAHDKDSSIFREATESYLGNSSYAKVVGRNMALTSQHPENANVVGVSREQLTGMLRSSRGSTTSDVAKNIRNLSYLLRSSGAKVEDYSDVEKLATNSWDQLTKIENKIIDGVLTRMQSGDLSLLSQVHRYPSTSGQDIRYASLALDDNLSGDAMSISRGLALTVNADYDGDKMWQRVLFANSDFDSYESFQKAQEAAKRIAQLDSQVSVLMQKWDDRQKSTPTDAKKAEDAFVKDLTDRGPNWLAALMSKTNKQYVGQFSNVSTNVRNFMQDFGMDEITKSGTRSAGLSSIVRAYLESLEQDSISAKKVFGRLSTQKGEGAAIDELSSLYASVSQGDFEGATRKSEAMNLGFAESRQLEFAKSVMQVYQPELYEKEFKPIFESDDVAELDKLNKQVQNGDTSEETAIKIQQLKTKITSEIMSLVREGLNLVTSTASAKGLNITDATYNTKARKIAKDKGKASGRGKKTSSSTKATSSTVAETKKKADEMLHEAQKYVSAFKSGSFRDKEGAAYTENHYREGTVNGTPYEDENILSVTGLISQYDKEIPAWEKEKMEVAAAKGTYAHKVAEILGRNQKLNLSKIQDESSLLELEQAQKELERALGFDATPELIDSLITRAQGLAKVASDEGLVGPNAQQEVTLGGVFDNGELKKAIAGQADIISTGKDGITVADYKFSSQGGPAMEAKRILQASIYLALYEKELQGELDKLNKQVEDGDTSEETSAKVEKVKGKLAASQSGRKVKILRSFEKNGDVFTEIVTANAMSQEDTLKALETLQITKELETKLAEIEQRINSGIANNDDTAEAARIRERLASIGKISASQILSQAQGMERVYKDASGKVVGDINIGSRRPSTNKLMSNYINNYKQQQRVQEKIQQANLGLEGKSGDSLLAQQNYLRALEQQLVVLKQQAPALDLINKKINEEQMSDEQIVELKNKINAADKEHLSRQAKITANVKQQQGFLGKLVGGLKSQMAMFIDTSLAYQAIGYVRSGISTLINTTKELDAALVDIQIATGSTREETRALMITYTDLAKEMGRTTQSVAQASNDWLRAGYEGKEAAELTKASMMLSTLGMIEATDATTYLISTLKGWKISAEEVIGVVDKLTAVDMAAAISAGDLALAMSRANNSARVAGSDMNKFIGYVTTVADVTQKSAESVGESFKTIYSRFGNVKANKYAATTADMSAADYNSDDFENLNDIETVLTKQGIKLRETAGVWRDIDTVIEEIATKWKTWDQTTKSAVATVVAGTRQRENVITLFENWEDVSKYAEIAENAYGTATKKMEAYTTSVDASRERLTVAVEKWALKLDEADAIKAFYDALTYTIENLHTLAIVLGGLATLANYDKVATTFASGMGKLGAKTMAFGNMFSGVKRDGGFKNNAKQIWQNTKETFTTPLENARIIRQQEIYGNTLTKFNATLGEELAVKARNVQSDLLMLSVNDRSVAASILEENLTRQQVRARVHDLSSQGQYTLAQTLLTNCTNDKHRAILESITADYKETASTEELARAEKALAAELRAQQGKGGMLRGGASRDIGKNLNDSTKIQNTTLGSTLAGIGTMAGGILGASISSTLTSEMDSTWQILGTVGGSMIASYAGKSIATGLASVIAGGTFSIPVVGWIAAIATGLGALFAWQKKKTEEAIKESQEAFTEAEQAYSKSKGAGSLAAKIDELSKGVDSLGRNISLTDEEYANFVSYNAQLIDIFPELGKHTDAQGNKFIDLGHNAETATSQVEGLQKALQNSVDAALLEPNVAGTNLSDAQKQAQENQEKINKAKNAKSDIKVMTSYLDEFQTEVVKQAYDSIVNQGYNLSDSGVKYFKQLDTYYAEAIPLENELNALYSKYGITAEDRTLSAGAEYMSKITNAEDLERYEDLRQQLMSWYGFDPTFGYEYDVKGAYNEWSKEGIQNTLEVYSVAPDALTSQYYGYIRDDEEYASQEIADSVAQSYDAQIQDAEYRMKMANKSMADEAQAIVRQSFSKEMENWSDEQIALAYSVAEGTSIFGENGQNLEWGAYRSNVESIVNKTMNVLGENENVLKYALELDNSETIMDIALARGQLKKALFDEFNKDGFFSVDEKAIMAHYGFEYDGESSTGLNSSDFKDVEDNVSALRDALGVTAGVGVPDEWGVYDMTEEEFAKVYELAQKGYLSAGRWEGYHDGEVHGRYRTDFTSKETLDNLIATKSAGDNKYSAINYQTQLLSGYDGFEDKITAYYESLNKATDNNIQAIGEKFSTLPEFMHQAILQGGEEILGGTTDITKQVTKQLEKYDQAVVNSMVNTATVFAQDQFSGIELDGYIDSWSELQQALEQVSSSYEKLSAARKEEQATGRLSWETTLDLLTTNMDYVNALKITADGIELKEDAEAIMMGVQIATIQANIDAAIAEKQLEIQSLRTSIQEAKSGQVTVTNTNANIDAHNAEIQSLNALAQAYAQVANLRIAATTGTLGDFSATDVEASLEKVTYTGAQLDALVETWKEQAGSFDEATGTWTEGSLHQDIKVLENLKGDLQTLVDSGYSAQVWESNFNTPDLDGGNVKDEFEKLRDLLGALNKEFYQMLAYADEGMRSLEGTAKKMHEAFYDVKAQLLDRAIARGEVLLGGRSLKDIYAIKDDEEFDKYLGYYTELQELYVERNNLDDEEIEDKIKIAELEGANLATMKDIYAQLIGVQNTYNSGVSLLDTSYFQGKLNQIYSEKKAISDILANNEEKLTEEELLKYREDLLKLDNEESALKDEYLNKLKEQFESEQSNLDIRKDLQKDLITHADTYEELLQRQQEYNDLLKEEQDLRQSIASALNEEYLAMSAFNSGSQTSYFDSKEEALKGVEEAINTRIMNNKFATGEIVPVQALETGHAPKGLQVGTYVSTSDGRIYQVMGVGETAFGSIEEGYNLGYSYNQASGYWSQETDFIANGTPLKDSDYISLIQDQQSNFVDQRNLDDERIQHEINLLKGQKADLNAITAQYKQLIETADTEEEYYEYYQQYLDAFIEEFDDKISDIQRQIDNLEKARPQEWKSTVDKSGKVVESATSKIKDYYSKMDQYYKNQKSAAEEALKYSAELTEEEIEHLVDQANDAIKSIHENAIAQAEDLKAYQESVYSALTNEVQRYIDDLEKQKENVEKTYDKELEKLQDKEDAIARTNKLIELQNNLLNAQKEKERVYREGIGWTYESNREKVKTAEDELNGFYRQDNIDDLNNAKDAELQNLNDRIKNWEDYLAMLNEKYNEYALLEEKRLLRELLNVETDAEIKAAIVADMTKFTTEIGQNYDTFIANQSAFYLSYNSTFSSFLTEYSNNLATLASLKATELSLLSSSSYGSVNLGGSYGSSGGGYYYGSDSDLMGDFGISAGWSWTNTDYLDSWIQGEGYENGTIYKNNNGTYTVYDGKQNYMGTINPDGSITSNAGDLGENYLNNANKFIQINDPNYGSNKTSGGGSGSKNNSWSGMVDSAKQNASSGGISGLTPSTSDNSNKTTTSNSGNSTKAVDDAVVNAVIRGNYGNGAARKEALTAAGYDASAVQKAVNDRLKGHADGILSGPVTYTGLTMLHGTSSEPEYVLNNDQAYNLLRYMATKKIPEFEVAGSNSSGVQYIVEGDIVLEGVDNPQEFWGEVTKAMGNRWNVTKNR